MEILLVLPPLVLVGFFVWYCSKDRVIEKKFFHNYFDKVRWIAIKTNFGDIYKGKKTYRVRDRDLVEYIIREQGELEIENKYCIDNSNEKEKIFICEILDTYKSHKINQLFFDSLEKNKILYQLDYLEYYMFSLFAFLYNDGEKREEFNNKVLYKYFSADGSYTTYKFTEYGIIYHKLLYITTLFCTKNKKIEPLFTNPKKTLKNIEENLEKEEITFWRYRP